MMKIQIESNDFDEKCLCELCGSIFRPMEVVARAYRDSGEFLTDVCAECVAVGVDGLPRRLQAQAEHLRSRAAALEALAREEIDTPSLEHLAVLNQIAKALR